MYDIDWLGENDPPPKKKRQRRTKAELEAAGYYAPKLPKKRGRKKGINNKKPRKYDAQERQASGKLGGRRKGSKNSPEVSAKAGETLKNSRWRRHSPNTGSTSMQSATGFADCTVFNGDGRVYPKRIQEDWNE